MKQHTTNYTNTFITVAEDCKAAVGIAPPDTQPKTAARIEYEMLLSSPYQYTSDDVLYQSNGNRKGISKDAFFSKGPALLPRVCTLQAVRLGRTQQ